MWTKGHKQLRTGQRDRLLPLMNGDRQAVKVVTYPEYYNTGRSVWVVNNRVMQLVRTLEFVGAATIILAYMHIDEYEPELRTYVTALDDLRTAANTRSAAPTDIYVALAGIEANNALVTYLENFIPYPDVLEGWQYIAVVNQSLE